MPNVIEPSFGIGRILYSLLEHSYWAREDDVNRGVLSLPPSVAPIKVLIVPLSGNADFKPMVREVCEFRARPRSEGTAELKANITFTAQTLRRLGISSRVDDSGASIGKRYARNDELGTPFGCTIDFACEYNGQ